MNNIFFDSPSSFLSWPATAGSQVLDHNIYFNGSDQMRWQRLGVSYTDFHAYQAAASEDNSLAADPRLAGASDAGLLPDSPAIDKGATFPKVPFDFKGVKRPQGATHDIGAFEFVTGGK